MSISYTKASRVRTISDRRDKTIHWHRSVEHHTFSHCLLSHEVAAVKSECMLYTVELNEYLSTRASEVSPAIAMPT